jgi:toxin YoeB
VRSIHFDPDACEDFLYWLAADRKMAVRITRLIGEIQRDPFAGIGKLERLKGDLSGYWSRRIDDEHRLVYRGIRAHGPVQIGQHQRPRDRRSTRATHSRCTSEGYSRSS